MLFSATLSLTGRHSEKLPRRFSNHWKICCYWIPLLSLVSSSHSFQPLSTSFNRPFHTSTLLSASSHDLEQLTVVQLKDKLRNLGLQVSGRKPVLINRLEDYNLDLAMAPSKKAKRAPKDEAVEETKAELPRKRSRKAEKEVEKDASDEPKKKSPVKKRKAADHQRITDRDEIPKLWDSEKAQENGSYS
jgi:ribosomal protein L12E/L44/L45/RPP1/RPP2